MYPAERQMKLQYFLINHKISFLTIKVKKYNIKHPCRWKCIM